MKETTTRVIYTKLIHSKINRPLLLTGWSEEIKWGKRKDEVDVSYHLGIQYAQFKGDMESSRFSVDGITISEGNGYKRGPYKGIAAFQRCVQALTYNAFSRAAKEIPSDKDLVAGRKFSLEHGCAVQFFESFESEYIDIRFNFGRVSIVAHCHHMLLPEFASKEVTSYFFTIIKEIDIFFKKAPSLHDGSHAISKGTKD